MLYLDDGAHLVQAYQAFRAAGEVAVEVVAGAFVERDHRDVLGPYASLA